MAATPVQSQFFLAGQLHPVPGLNTITRAVRIRGPLVAGRLSQALGQACARHCALRTRLAVTDGTIGRVVADEAAAEPLETRPAPASDDALLDAVEGVRGALSPETIPWKAVLLRHDPDDHTLVFAAHRSIWDERSTERLGAELSELYAAQTAHRALPAPTPENDFVPLTEAAATEGARHFAATLAEVPPIHGFPIEGARPKSLEVEAAGVELAFDAATGDLLAKTAERWGLSPFVLEVAGVAYVLAQYCGQERVAVGLPFDLSPPGRPRSLGSLTAILPLGLDVGGANFEALARAVGERYASAARYAATPFHAVVKESGVRTDASANALFQSACVEDGELTLALEGCQCAERPVTPPPQQLDLFLELTPKRLRLGYASQLISRELAHSFCRSVTVFLEAALREPGRALSGLPLLDPKEQQALLSNRDRTAEPSFLEHDLYALITRHCTSDNGKKALVSSGRSLTYAQLRCSVESIAQALSGSGLKPGALVGICLPRSVEMVAAMLGVLRGGSAYVPLDPAFPIQRLQYMVDHSGLSHIITTRALRPMFKSAGLQFLEIDPPGAPGSSPLAAPAPVAAGAPAYVIYTSGSTGKPKGVAVPRVALANLLLSMLQRPGVSVSDTVCAVTTLSFDIAVLELLAPLVAGGTVVIATEEEARDPRLLIGLLQTHRVTLLQATPVTWQMLCAAGWSGDKQLTALCGGEALAPSLAQALVPRVGALWNMYGPTETTVWSTCHRIEDPSRPISVGTPIHNTALYVLDSHGRQLPANVEGRLVIGGAGVAIGYLHDEALTARQFVADPFSGRGRIYDTGDRARQDRNGLVYVVGRSDFQVKLRGFRIELGEIEARVSTFNAVEQVVCVVRRDDPDNPELVAYYTLKASAAEPTIADLRAHCGAALPTHMVPSRFVRLDALPRTLNGKVDRGALPGPTRGPAAATLSAGAPVADSGVERTLLEIWCSVLSIPNAGARDNFFELGGTSLAAFSVAQQISKRLGSEISVLRIFEHPTITSLAKYLEGNQAATSPIRDAHDRARKRRQLAGANSTAFDVAIIGLAGRFPGARTVDELWKNLHDGRETVTFFKREELDPLVPAHDRADKNYIPARGVLEDIDQFDAAFFGISPNEAELMDPQLRVFMETAWEAFENAGYVGEEIRGLVGVWAGMGNNFYYHYNVLTRPDKLAVMGEIAAEMANEKDHIAPRISHKLNLTGPSLSVHTACSTTLVVIENAYQALVTHQVDVALAGGIDIRTPQKSGQRYEDGGVFSIDGHCRPFDASATGTMFGEGVGAVVLKRLDDALADGDTIHAVIKGAAVNHDGGHKAGYLAPSVEGQARVIATALAIGDVHPDTITMIEAHGTATPIGDPIEVEALTRVYRIFTQRRRYCAIGSIKGNFGHATSAAGIAGVLKVVLAMKHHQIPATLYFKTPNPQIDFETSPFFVADKLLDWNPPGVPRRASVSSFGFCGTNAHVILEEAPPARPTSAPLRPAQLVLMSARNKKALDATAERLAAALDGVSPTQLADLAFTTHVGRKRHEHRRCAVVSGAQERASLTQAAGAASASLESEADNPPVVFMFPGQGAQYVNMGLRLYEQEPVFRASIDACARTLEPHLGVDLRAFLFPAPSDAEKAQQSLNNTFYTQPAIYTVSYSLAMQFQHWGIQPSSFIGHSIGEFVAATLAGVMERDDALRLVATRGRLMQALPGGSMLSVRLPAEKVIDRLPAGIDLASVNSPQLCVVAGPTEAIAAFAEKLTAEGAACRTLHTSHAFHSSMMDPVVEPFQRAVEAVRLSPPRIPFVSTVLGDWIPAAEATSPAYWARHLRSPVQFSKAVKVLLEDKRRVLLELGPRRTSAMLALQHRPANPDRIIASMPDGGDPDDEYTSLLLALGSLWLNGCRVDWPAFHEGETRRRVPMPTYPFQRRRFWIEPGNTISFGLGQAVPGAQLAASPVASRAATDGASVPGTRVVGDEITRAVVPLLEQLLGTELEGFDEDARFIALGLDSLLLTQLARMVRARLGFEVTFRQLTERYSTTRLLTDAIRASRPPAPPKPAEAPPPKPAEAPAAPVELRPRARLDLAATPAQIEMWLSELAGPEAGCAYNESFAVDLEGDVNDAALEHALQTLPELHDALRGHFSEDGEHFVIEPSLAVPIAHHDLSDLPPEERAASLRQLIESNARTPYDIEHGPLFRGAVIKLDEKQRTVLLSAHHAVCDGWSLDVLLMDLARLYSGQVKTTPVAPPSHSFADFVAHRATPGYARQIEASRAFWRKTFEQLPPPLELPHDGRRPPVRSYGANHVFRLGSSELLAAVKALSRKEGISFFSVLLSSFAALLHRISGTTDVVVGIPVAGHPEVGMEEAVGHLVNLVPVRCRIDGQQSFLALCRATHNTILDAREHAAVSFGEIVASLSVPRDPARVPLVPVVFTHVQKYAPGKLTFAGCSVEYHLSPRAFETFELDLNVVESHDSLEFKIHGNADLYSQQWLDWRMRELERLLKNGCANPETTVATVGLMPDEEAGLIEQFNRTAAEFPRDATVLDLFERQAARTPEALAVRCGTESMRYRELDARANQLAHALRRRGVGRGSLVGLCLTRSVEMVAAMLGVLKAGGAYLPLDPAFPSARLAFMVEDSGLTLVVSQTGLAGDHGAGPAKTLALDGEAAALRAESTKPLARDDRSARPEDAAYVLYTSGSTGKPKGVCVPHRAAVNLLTSMQREPGIRASDRLLAVTTLSFDIALVELVLPLTVGAEVIIATRDQAIDVEALQNLIREGRVTMLQATPATWRMLVDGGWEGTPGLLAITGGEALQVDLAEALVARVGQLWNMYGPTETTVYSTACRITEPRSRITIGRPIANTSVRILDPVGQVCPVGVPGEICIGGEGVALGYLNRAELTRERFIADRFSTRPGALLYRTGDLGRWRADGLIDCIGRTDFQVKVRGFRIELGEIETRLAEHPAVREVCVVVREVAPGDSTIVAYFSPRPGQSVTSTDLRAHVRGALPDYMVPQTFVELAELPRTQNGKFDRKALPAPFAEATPAQALVLPRNPAEQLVAEVWGELLGRKQVGVHENFFEAGGHSLLVVQAIGKIAKRTGVRLNPRAFVVDTLGQIAAQLEVPPKAAPPLSALGTAPPPDRGLLGRLKSRLFK